MQLPRNVPSAVLERTSLRRPELYESWVSENQEYFRKKAKREERKVVSQSVSIHTDICPECGKVYVSGGTTRTVTSADSKPEQESGAQQRKPFFAVA